MPFIQFTLCHLHSWAPSSVTAECNKHVCSTIVTNDPCIGDRRPGFQDRTGHTQRWEGRQHGTPTYCLHVVYDQKWPQCTVPTMQILSCHSKSNSFTKCLKHRATPTILATYTRRRKCVLDASKSNCEGKELTIRNRSENTVIWIEISTKGLEVKASDVATKHKLLIISRPWQRRRWCGVQTPTPVLRLRAARGKVYRCWQILRVPGVIHCC